MALTQQERLLIENKFNDLEKKFNETRRILLELIQSVKDREADKNKIINFIFHKISELNGQSMDELLKELSNIL